ncbi:MAG: tyrosine-protein phosphatase [Ahrensia sp.]|nr:tyrosine-protein phosphatase [Ahrensia sp.]
MKISLLKLARNALLVVTTLPLFGAMYLGTQYYTGNLHTVVKGELYRSGQPSPDMIRMIEKDHGIRSIINLRGSNYNADWYRKERQVSEQLGIEHVDFGMSAKEEVSPERIRQLVARFNTLPKPILIHCEGGADRSGLASAIYLALVKQEPINLASNQLSILYGHIDEPFAVEPDAMHKSLAHLVANTKLLPKVFAQTAK